MRLRKHAWLSITAALVLPAAAQANTHTVTFDDLPTGTTVTTQYVDAGGSQQGLEFGYDYNGTAAGVQPTVTTDTSNVNHVGDICLCNGEFHTIDTWGRFPFLKHTLSIDVGAFGAAGYSQPVELDGYDAAGTLIGSQTATIASGAPVTTMTLSSPTGQLAFFELRRTDNGGSPVVYVDNIAYDVPAVPPPAAYAIHWPGPIWAGSDFATSTGTSIGTTVAVTRVNGSTGPVSFSAGNLPAGVTAAFSPSAPTAASSVKVTFTVAGNAPGVTDHPITITGTAVNPGASGPSPRTTTIKLTVLGRYDEQIRGIEVVQSVQSVLFPTMNTTALQRASLPQLPVRDPAHPFAEVPYAGVNFATDGTTVARVWANITSATALPLPPVPVALHAFDIFGHELPGSPLIGDQRTLTVNPRPFVTWDDMVNPAGSWNFVLPASWTEHGLLKLTATLLPSNYFETVTQSECDQPICIADNSFTLTNIPFISTNPVSMTPVAMTVGNETLAPPGQVFQQAESLIPTFDGGFEFSHGSYAGTIDISDLNSTLQSCISDVKATESGDDVKEDIQDCSDNANDDTLSRLDDWADGHGHGRITIGVNSGTARGVTIGSIGSFFHPHPDAVVDLRRPLTSVAHELFHALGRSHASDCNGGGGDDWPPDQEGWIHGIGFDRNGNGGLGLFGPIAPPVPVPSGLDASKVLGTPGAAFDFMSYCAFVIPDYNSWISDRGWNETLQYLHDNKGTDARDPASTAAATPSMHVLGWATKEGIHITTVAPELDGPAAHRMTGPSTSSFTLQIKNSSGHAIASAPMIAIGGHNDRSGPVVLLDASVPVAGAGAAAGDGRVAAAAIPASVSISTAGLATATRKRDAHIPVVRVLSPRAGATVGRGRFTTIRFRAHDADHDRLIAKVQYSFDGGRTWTTLWTGPASGRARLPSALLSGSRQARIRVRVNDGFNEGRAVSGLFTAIGAAPQVMIATPKPRARVPADGVLSVVGQAYDDRGNLIYGRRLSWFVGRRLVGRGSKLALSGLPTGRTRLRLVARAAGGRTGSTSVPITVAPSVPQVLSLSTPRHLSGSARSLTIRIAATELARLSVGRRHFKLSRTPRAITIPITPGAGPLNLKLTLVSGKLHSSLVVIIARGA